MHIIITKIIKSLELINYLIKNPIHLTVYTTSMKQSSHNINTYLLINDSCENESPVFIILYAHSD